MIRASYFMVGFITAMMLFLIHDYGFPIWLGASVFIVSIGSCFMVQRTIP